MLTTFELLLFLVVVTNIVSFFSLVNGQHDINKINNDDNQIKNNNDNNSSYYTAYDDSTWAVMDRKLSNSHRQSVYDIFMNGCRTKAGIQRAYRLCDHPDNYRMQMNMYQTQSMKNFTKTGFKKLRAPKEVMELLHSFWLNNKDFSTVEWSKATPYHNTWETEPTLVSIEDEYLEGGGYALRSKVANYVRDEIEKWTGMKQTISSVYGIRTYHNGSMLAPHVDRLPLVSSAILNVAQDVDEDWPLEVYDHNGIAHNITMKPGDLVLYESHSIIHGRPFAMKGNYYANVFVHFEPLGPLNKNNDTIVNDNIVVNNISYPPYVVPGTSWEPEWLRENPNGWNLLQDIQRLVRDGDLTTIQYVSSIVHPSLLLLWNGTDEWKPIHEVIRHSHFDILKYLIEVLHVDLSTSCTSYQGTPYKMALIHHGKNHPITQYLHSIRGTIEGNDIEHTTVVKSGDTNKDEDDDGENFKASRVEDIVDKRIYEPDNPKQCLEKDI